MVRLSHEADVTQAQVAEAAVDELDDALDVPDPKSPPPRVRRRALARRGAAVAAPITPPPITSRSKRPRPSSSRARPAPRRPLRATGFVHARRPAGSTTSSRANRAVDGRSRRAGDDPVRRRVPRGYPAVPVAEPAGVHGGAARLAHSERDRTRGRAPNANTSPSPTRRRGSAAPCCRRTARSRASRTLSAARSARIHVQRGRSRSPDGGCRR